MIQFVSNSIPIQIDLNSSRLCNCKKFLGVSHPQTKTKTRARLLFTPSFRSLPGLSFASSVAGAGFSYSCMNMNMNMNMNFFLSRVGFNL